jgi:hypothetical protein
VFRVHKAQCDGGFVLHVIHISGKRMKASGVDGFVARRLNGRHDGWQGPFGVHPFQPRGRRQI